MYQPKLLHQTIICLMTIIAHLSAGVHTLSQTTECQMVILQTLCNYMKVREIHKNIDMFTLHDVSNMVPMVW